MKKVIVMKTYILILLTLFISCSTQQIDVPPPTQTPICPVPMPESNPPEPPLEENKTQIPENTPRTKGAVEKKFENYLLSREIKPLLTINNDYDGVRNEREETIKVSNHKITWFHSFKEARVKINDDLFSVKNESSLNDADDEAKIDGNIVNNWDEIKLFKINGRELIGISMGNSPCTGLMCSVSFYLIYDLKTKNKNFFGNFRTDIELKLYDFGKDGTIDFLSSTSNFTYTPGFEITNIYNFYTLNKKGVFQLQKDKNKKPYFIKRVFNSDNEEEFDDKFEQN
jgi:hypothetical protein